MTTDPEDILDLEILRLHKARMTDAQIARQLGQTRQRVTSRRARIITDDCLVEPIAETYWYSPETPT